VSPTRKRPKKPKGRAQPRSAATTGTGKGGVFERAVALALSLWWGDEKGLHHTERSFRRTPGSGGIDPHEWPGDVMPTRRFAHLWPLVIECKARDSEFGDLIELLTAPGHKLFEWMDQAQRDAQGVGRWWWLVVRRVHYPWLLFQDWRTWQRLTGEMSEGSPMDGEPFFRFRRPGPSARFVSICRFDPFLESITPDALCRALPIRETRYEQPRRRR